MEQLVSFSSRLLVSNKDDTGDEKTEISADDRSWIENYCTQLNEMDSEVLMLWIRKIKNTERKRVKRIVVVTKHRLLTLRKTGDKTFETRREGHILDLESVQESGLTLTIKFRSFELAFQCNEDTVTTQVLNTLYKNYQLANPGFPMKLTCKWLDQYKASQATELAKKIPVVGNQLAPWERPCRAFASYCQFYKEPDVDKLVGGLKALLRRPLDDGEERWLRSSDLGVNNPKTLYGLVMSVSFTNGLLHGLEIVDIDGDAELYFALQCLMQNNATLKSLILDGVSTTPDWGKLMFGGLNGNQKSSLIRFGLLNCRITDKGLNYWISNNKKLARQPECVYMTRSGASQKTMVQFIQSLQGTNSNNVNGNQFGGLTELDISWNELDQRGTQMLFNRLVKDFTNLKVLKVAHCKVAVPRLLVALEAAITQNNLELEELDVSGNKMTDNDGLQLSKLIAKSGHIGGLQVAACGLTGKIIAALAASLLVNEQLKFYVRFDCSDNSIGAEAAVMIASVFVQCDRLMSLKMNNCDLTHEGLGYILFSLKNQPRLKILELDCNCKRKEWNTGRFHVSQLLRQVLECCLNLESLSIKNDPEREFQVELDHFLFALRTNENLLSLDISGNSMTPDNLKDLKEVIVKNQTLRELHWDTNNIQRENIVAMTHSLANNKGLQVLEFPKNDFSKLMAAEKDKNKQMELQLLKKRFFQAVFDSNTQQGFASTAVSIQRNMAKRNSIVNLNRGPRPFYEAPKGTAKLGLPEPSMSSR